jgi:hypothetical protein
MPAATIRSAAGRCTLPEAARRRSARPTVTLISYVTQPGKVALDDGHSPYARALATTMKRPGLDLFQTFNEVGLTVE